MSKNYKKQEVKVQDFKGFLFFEVEGGGMGLNVGWKLETGQKFTS